jgi:hypothetical protein
VTFSVVGLRELERSFSAMAKATARGEARAVNRVATSITTAQSRAIVKLANLKVSRVKESVRLAQKATPNAPRIVMEVQRRPVGLIQFGGSWRGPKSQGATAKVWRGTGRDLFAGTFIVTGRGGNRQIFDRKGKKRLPIKAYYGPSVYSMFLRDDIQRVGADTWALRLPIELDRETQFALRQAGLI